MGMIADGYNLSCPQLGAVSSSSFDEGWGCEEIQSGTMWLGCVSCKPKAAAAAAADKKDTTESTNYDRSKENVDTNN